MGPTPTCFQKVHHKEKIYSYFFCFGYTQGKERFKQKKKTAVRKAGVGGFRAQDMVTVCLEDSFLS